LLPELTVAGRPLGSYFLQWMHSLPEDEFGGPVILRFGPLCLNVFNGLFLEVTSASVPKAR